MIQFVILEDIKQILKEKLNLNKDDIKMTSRLRMDLNIQSWGRTLLFANLERSYDITFTYNETSSPKIIRDVITIIYTKLNRK